MGTSGNIRLVGSGIAQLVRYNGSRRTGAAVDGDPGGLIIGGIIDIFSFVTGEDTILVCRSGFGRRERAVFIGLGRCAEKIGIGRCGISGPGNCRGSDAVCGIDRDAGADPRQQDAVDGVYGSQTADLTGCDRGTCHRNGAGAVKQRFRAVNGGADQHEIAVDRQCGIFQIRMGNGQDTAGGNGDISSGDAHTHIPEHGICSGDRNAVCVQDCSGGTVQDHTGGNGHTGEIDVAVTGIDDRTVCHGSRAVQDIDQFTLYKDLIFHAVVIGIGPCHDLAVLDRTCGVIFDSLSVGEVKFKFFAHKGIIHIRHHGVTRDAASGSVIPDRPGGFAFGSIFVTVVPVTAVILDQRNGKTFVIDGIGSERIADIEIQRTVIVQDIFSAEDLSRRIVKHVGKNVGIVFHIAHIDAVAGAGVPCGTVFRAVHTVKTEVSPPMIARASNVSILDWMKRLSGLAP